MNTMILTALVMLTSFLATHAQWSQTNGPEGGNISAIAHIDGATIAIARPGRLYRLADGATRWTYLGPTIPTDRLHAVGSTLLATTTQDGVKRSVDGGASWMRLPLRIRGVEAVNGGIAYAIGTDPFISTDSGATWRSVAGNLSELGGGSFDVQSLIGSGDTLLTSSPLVAGIARSTDGGRTWSMMTLGLPDSSGASALAYVGGTYYAQIIDEHKRYIHGIFRSTDGGSTWSEITAGLPTHSNGYAFAFGLTEENGRLGAMTTGGYYVLEDTSWVGAEARIVVGTSSDDDGNLYRALFDGIRKSDDGGLTWSRIDNGMLSQNVTTITTSGSAVLAAASQGIFRSTDRGASWQQTGYDRVESFVRDGALILAAGGPGTNVGILRSTNGGASWEPANLGIDRDTRGLSSIAAASGVAYAAYNDPDYRPGPGVKRLGGLYRSSDGGSSWSLVRAGLPVSGDTTLAVRKVAALGRYAVALTYSGLYRSVDSGMTWNEVATDVLDIHIAHILTAHRGALYLARTTEVWVSYDGGATWLETGGASGGLNRHAYNLSTVGDRLVALVREGDSSRAYRFAETFWEPSVATPNGVLATAMTYSDGRIYTATEANSVMRFDVVAGVDEQHGASAVVRWFPHPVRGEARVTFTLERPSNVALELVSTDGERAISVGAQRYDAGEHGIAIDARQLTPGAYGYRLTVDETVLHGVVMIVR